MRTTKTSAHQPAPAQVHGSQQAPASERIAAMASRTQAAHGVESKSVECATLQAFVNDSPRVLAQRRRLDAMRDPPRANAVVQRAMINLGNSQVDTTTLTLKELVDLQRQLEAQSNWAVVADIIRAIGHFEFKRTADTADADGFSDDLKTLHESWGGDDFAKLAEMIEEAPIPVDDTFSRYQDPREGDRQLGWMQPQRYAHLQEEVNATVKDYTNSDGKNVALWLQGRGALQYSGTIADPTNSMSPQVGLNNDRVAASFILNRPTDPPLSTLSPDTKTVGSAKRSSETWSAPIVGLQGDVGPDRYRYSSSKEMKHAGRGKRPFVAHGADGRPVLINHYESRHWKPTDVLLREIDQALDQVKRDHGVDASPLNRQPLTSLNKDQLSFILADLRSGSVAATLKFMIEGARGWRDYRTSANQLKMKASTSGSTSSSSSRSTSTKTPRGGRQQKRARRGGKDKPG